MEYTLVHDSLTHAATCIIQHSFALYKIEDKDTIDLMEQSSNCAYRFLVGTDKQTTMTTTRSRKFSDTKAMTHLQKQQQPKQQYEYQRIVNGHLQGYNEPSNAKVIYRAFCGTCTQPWPNDEFKELSTQLSNKLHDLLVKCCIEVHTIVSKTTTTTFCSEQRQQQQHPRRQDGPPPILHGNSNDKDIKKKDSTTKKEILDKEETYDSNSNNSNHRYHHDKNNKRLKLSSGGSAAAAAAAVTFYKDCVDKKSCPLDYYLYHGNYNNKSGDGVTVVRNCSEHIDRGILICVCLTNVPGLEVQPYRTNSFFCPENQVNNKNNIKKGKAFSSSGVICIMAGDQLKHVLQKTVSTLESQNLVQACVHRVRDDFNCERLSISYELRS